MSNSQGSSESMLSKIIVGVAVAVITAVILSFMGLGGNNNVRSDPQPTPPPDTEMAEWCCDTWDNKRCQLVSPVPVGSSCFCPGQGYGYACK